MIIACTTDPEEAADLAEVLIATLPETWGFRIFMLGNEVKARTPKNAEADSRREAMHKLIRDAGPEGIAARTLFLKLQAAGQYLPRATMYRWLTEDQEKDLIFSPSYGRRAAKEHEQETRNGNRDAGGS
jgi:hypothetical protein